MSLKQSATNVYRGSPAIDSTTPDRVEIEKLFGNVTHNKATVAELLADTSLSYTTGANAFVAENDIVTAGGFPYRVAASGATDHHIATSAGAPVKFYVNSGKYEQNAEAWGVKLTGNTGDGTANSIALQAAIDYLDSEGQGGKITLASDGECVVDLPPMLKDRITIDLGGGILRNNRTAAEYDGFLSTQALQVGKMHPRHMDILPWQKLDAVGFGDDGVTLSTPADATDYQAGDMVLVVEATANMGGTTKSLPAWAQWDRVHAVSGGVLQLERGIAQAIDAGAGTLGTSAAGAWVSNVSFRVRDLVDWESTDLSGWIDGAPFMCYRPSVVNGTLITSHGGVIQGVGMFDGLWENLKCNPGEAADGRGFGGVYSNAFANSRLHRIVSSCYERAIEIKCLSQDTLIDDFEVYQLNHPHATSEEQAAQIAVGEKSRGIMFRNGVVNLTDWQYSVSPSTGQNLINFTPAFDCGFQNVTFRAKSAFARLAFANSDSTGCFVRDCIIDAPSSVAVETESAGFDFSRNDIRQAPSTYAIRLDGAMTGGKINDNTFAVESGVKILAADGATNIGTEIARNRGLSAIDDDTDGARALIKDNRNAGWDAVLLSAVNSEQRNITINDTTEVAIGRAIVVPAGVLASGDFFDVEVEISASSGSIKYLTWRMAVDTNDNGTALDASDDTNIVGTLEVPDGTTDFIARFTGTVQGSNALITSAHGHNLTTGAVSGDVDQKSAADFANFPLRMELSGYRDTAGGAYVVRAIRRRGRRAGYLNA